MKKNNWWKAGLLTLAIAACISIPLILYFTVGQNSSGGGSSDQVNLDNESVSYLADVDKMTSITGAEATTIRNGIQTNITNKMNSLNLEANVDYQINNVDMIQNGINLNDVLDQINVSSLPESTKATGTLFLQLNVREDLSTRSISTKDVPTDEAENLGALTADSLVRNIRLEVSDLLTEGQNNDEGIDYQIVNINLIVPGAKFADYSTALRVTPINSSTHWKGQFSINFQLQ